MSRCKWLKYICCDTNSLWGENLVWSVLVHPILPSPIPRQHGVYIENIQGHSWAARSPCGFCLASYLLKDFNFRPVPNTCHCVDVPAPRSPLSCVHRLLSQINSLQWRPTGSYRDSSQMLWIRSGGPCCHPGAWKSSQRGSPCGPHRSRARQAETSVQTAGRLCGTVLRRACWGHGVGPWAWAAPSNSSSCALSSNKRERGICERWGCTLESQG